MLQRNILCFNKMIQPSSVKKIYSWCNCYRYIVLRKSLVSFFLKPKNNWLTLIRDKRVYCCWPTLLPSFEFPHQTNFIKHAMVINMPSYKFLRQNIPLEKVELNCLWGTYQLNLIQLTLLLGKSCCNYTFPQTELL